MKEVKVKILNDALVGGEGYSKGDTPTLNKDDFDRLEELGLAREYDAELDEEPEKGDTSVLEAKVSTLEDDKTQLEAKVSTLEDDKTQLEAKVSTLEDAELLEKIKKLEEFVEEAISLPKGQKPKGYGE